MMQRIISRAPNLVHLSLQWNSQTIQCWLARSCRFDCNALLSLRKSASCLLLPNSLCLSLHSVVQSRFPSGLWTFKWAQKRTQQMTIYGSVLRLAFSLTLSTQTLSLTMARYRRILVPLLWVTAFSDHSNQSRTCYKFLQIKTRACSLNGCHQIFKGDPLTSCLSITPSFNLLQVFNTGHLSLLHRSSEPIHPLAFWKIGRCKLVYGTHGL